MTTPPAQRRPAHEGITKYIATLEDENTRLKAELEVLRRRYDVLLAQTNERSPEGSAQ